MDENNMIICPFCQETDFDAVGLKHHLLSGGCEKFNATITIEQERHLSNQSSGRNKPKPPRYDEMYYRTMKGVDRFI